MTSYQSDSEKSVRFPWFLVHLGSAIRLRGGSCWDPPPCSLLHCLCLCHCGPRFDHDHLLYSCSPHRYHLWPVFPVSVTATVSSISGPLSPSPLSLSPWSSSVLSVSLCDTVLFMVRVLSLTLFLELLLPVLAWEPLSQLPQVWCCQILCFFLCFL